MLSGLTLDIKAAVRSLAGHRRLVVITLLALGLGVGANFAIFTLVSNILLSPLPYPEPERIVSIWERGEKGSELHVAAANFLDWQQDSETFEAMAAHTSYRFGGRSTVLGGGRPAQAWVAPVTAEFFDVFGMQPARGRSFTEDEARAGGNPAAVVSHDLWTDLLSARWPLDDLTLDIRGTLVPVVGVMPRGFTFPAQTDVWVPLAFGADPGSRTAHNWAVVGRLRPGASIDQAAREIDRITGRIRTGTSEEVDAVGGIVRPLRQEVVGDSSRALWLLFGASAFLLLIACVNVTSALLAHVMARASETAIRQAIGAGRNRIARQHLVESLLLAASGAAVGIPLGWILVRAVRALAPDLPRLQEVEISPTLVLFGLGIALLTALLVGLPTIWRACSEDLSPLLGGTRSSLDRGRLRLWRSLVAAEVALAVLLLIGAGLLLRTVSSLLHVDPGFDPEGVLVAEVTLPSSNHPEDPDLAAFHRRLEADLRQLPGVDSVGLTSHLPLTGTRLSGGFEIEGRGAVDGQSAYRAATAGYFEALAIPLLRGRLFEERDAFGGGDVAVVNQAFVDRFFPGTDVLGRRIRNLSNDAWRYPDRWVTLIGVVGDVRQRSLDTEDAPAVYVFARQRPFRTRNAFVTLHTSAPPTDLTQAVRETVASIDPQVPLQITTMEARLEASLAQRRFTQFLISFFALAALLLASVGIFGVVSFSTRRRMQELGIRTALGASPGELLKMIVGDALRPVLVGVVVGLVGSILLVRTIEGLLYGVGVHDPAVFLGVSLLLVAVAAFSAAIPGLRAVRLDTVEVLRAP